MSGVILLGGGIDSTSLLVWLRKLSPELPLNGFHVDYGQKAFAAEEKSNEYFCKKYAVLLKSTQMFLQNIAEASILRGALIGKTQQENKLEGRNIILIALAATYASTIGADKVFVGFHKEAEDAPFPDATWNTYECMGRVLTTSYRPKIFLEAPFRHYSRLEVFKNGLTLDEEIATKTFTCYEGGEKECGVCVHCKNKTKMMEQIGVER